MATYVLLFDASGRSSQTFPIPKGKRVYLVRPPQESKGTATISDLINLVNFTIPDGRTICETNIKDEGENVTLAFMSRTNQNILFVNVEVISPREDVEPCN